MKNLIFFSLLFSVFLFSCKKESAYTLTVINPESYSIQLSSNDISQTIIGPNSSEVFSGTTSNGSEVFIQTTYDSEGNGDYYTQYAPRVEFTVVDDGSYTHILGSGVVTEN